MKIHVLTSLYGNPKKIFINQIKCHDREALYELSEITNIQNLMGDNGYIGKISEDIFERPETIKTNLNHFDKDM